MLDISSFHSRLCDFAANEIINYNEMVGRTASSGRYSGATHGNTAMKQGELFAEPENAKSGDSRASGEVLDDGGVSSTPQEEKPLEKPLDKNLNYSDYKRIFCGNSLAATYWFDRNNQEY